MIVLWIVLIVSAVLTFVDMDECVIQEYMGEVGPVCTVALNGINEPTVFLIGVSFMLTILLTVYWAKIH